LVGWTVSGPVAKGSEEEEKGEKLIPFGEGG